MWYFYLYWLKNHKSKQNAIFSITSVPLSLRIGLFVSFIIQKQWNVYLYKREKEDGGFPSESICKMFYWRRYAGTYQVVRLDVSEAREPE